MLLAVVWLYVLSREIPCLLLGDTGTGVPLAAGTLLPALPQTTSRVLRKKGEPSSRCAACWGRGGQGHCRLRSYHHSRAGLTEGGLLGTASLDLTAVTLRLGPVIQPMEGMSKPGFAAMTMGVGVRPLYDQLAMTLGSTHAATFLAMGGGMVIFGVVILLTGGVRAATST